MHHFICNKCYCRLIKIKSSNSQIKEAELDKRIHEKMLERAKKREEEYNLKVE